MKSFELPRPDRERLKRDMVEVWRTIEYTRSDIDVRRRLRIKGNDVEKTS